MAARNQRNHVQGTAAAAANSSAQLNIIVAALVEVVDGRGEAAGVTGERRRGAYIELQLVERQQTAAKLVNVEGKFAIGDPIDNDDRHLGKL